MGPKVQNFAYLEDIHVHVHIFIYSFYVFEMFFL